MPRETSYLSIILKKQPLNEADELVTAFSREAGKIRALAKSSKSAKSKLQHGLQVLFLVKMGLAGSNLPKIIGVEVLETFADIRNNLEASKIAFYALELLLKFTADEHKNEKLFDLYLEFFGFLDASSSDIEKLGQGLAKFKIDFPKALGLTVTAAAPKNYAGQIGFTPTPISDKSGRKVPYNSINVGQKNGNSSQLVWGFSNSRGGFVFGQRTRDVQIVSPQVFSQFLALRDADFSALTTKPIALGDIAELQSILSSFLEYQLEREIKSERFLKS
jgi:Recombination protein O N terminal/Recombination protein O C terminal